MPRLLTLKAVLARVPVSALRLYGWMNSDLFPLPVLIENRVPVWYEAAIEAWMKSVDDMIPAPPADDPGELETSARSAALEVNATIPVPPRVPHNVKYPFAAMEIGDSFFVPTDGRPVFQSRISSCAHLYAKRHGNGLRFITRTCTELALEGVRVWRVA